MENLPRFALLVVDDEEALRDVISYGFRRKGFTVFSAENGKKAFEVVRTQKIDLVISDIRMPGGDGLSLLEHIRKHNPKIPIVVLITAFADVTESECICRGAREVIHKPFELKCLTDSVLKALGRDSLAA